MKKLTITLLATTLGFTSFASGARAQGVFNMGSLTNTLSMDAATQSERERSVKLKSSLKSQFSSSKMTQKKVTPVSTQFRSNASVRKRNLDKFAMVLGAKDAKVAAELKQSFARQDPISQAAPALKRYNMRTDDVADAMTIYLINAWFGMRGSTQEPTQAQVNGVRQQMKQVLASVPEFAKTSDASKQETADSMIFSAIIADQSVTQAKGKTALMNQTKAAIKQAAIDIFGFDLTKVKLTSAGLHV